MYGLITTLCEQLPFFIIERAKLFCTTSLGSLSESDPVVVGPLWEAALMVIGRIRVYMYMYIQYTPSHMIARAWSHDSKNVVT